MTGDYAGCKGLTDKIYWRPGIFGMGIWHAFKKDPKDGYRSLCGNQWRAKSGGQSCARPSAMLRCAQCDIAEMKRRDWEESGPESSGWEEWL